MLRITIPTIEYYDEVKEEFFTSKETVLQLEHSLVSLSKWESKWHKPFLSKEPKTIEETIDYVKCMTINSGVDPEAYLRITPSNMDEITSYIEANMTATVFSNQDHTINRSVITAEIIYYWMVALNIPFECEKWHLDRLLTLINVCNIKSQPPKKMRQTDTMRRNAALNAARKRQFNTSG